MSPNWSRRALLATVGAASLTGCLGDDETQSDTVSAERVVEDWWDAIEAEAVERFRELYHPDSPERAESYWDSEEWADSFPPESLEEATVAERTLLEETADTAVVRDAFADHDPEDMRSHAGFTHHLRPDGDDWRLWTHELETYICPDNEPGERQADDLPDRCPVSTLEGYRPPETLSCETVAEFVAEYHEAYVLQERFSPAHERDSVGGTVTGIDRHEDGYVVVFRWDGADYSTTAILRGERVSDASESDVPSVETLDSAILREVAGEAAQGGDARERVGSGGSKEDAVPEELRREFESLPGDEDGRYVTVDGTPILLGFSTETTHGDYLNMTTRYYVDSHVVRQYESETDPRQGTLLECQP